MKNTLIPLQQSGSEMDLQSAEEFVSIAEAKSFFNLAKLRLKDVNNWDRTCGTNATNFKITLPDGRPSFRLEVGNLIQIDIPGPGTLAGEGYDWVRIEDIDENISNEAEEGFGFRVRPCTSPTNKDESVAHFFSDVATSTFMVRRKGTFVIAEMHGRNEMPNTANEKIVDGIRNTIVGWSAKMGLSYPQWQLLMEGLVKKAV